MLGFLYVLDELDITSLLLSNFYLQGLHRLFQVCVAGNTRVNVCFKRETGRGETGDGERDQ